MSPVLLSPASPATYVCGRCKQSVSVFVPAVVTCSRCGRAMRREEETSHVECADPSDRLESSLGVD